MAMAMEHDHEAGLANRLDRLSPTKAVQRAMGVTSNGMNNEVRYNVCSCIVFCQELIRFHLAHTYKNQSLTKTYPQVDSSAAPQTDNVADAYPKMDLLTPGEDLN